MPSQKRLSELIHAIYAAAENQDRWQPFLELLAGELGCGTTILIAVGDDAAGPNISVAARTDPELIRLYNESWGAHDPWLSSGHESLTREGAVIVSQDVVADRDLVRSSFYNDFMRRFDMFQSVVATIAARPGLTAGVSCHFHGPPRPRSRRELDLLRLLAPHLGQALRFHFQLAAGRASAVPGLVLDRAGVGFILLDGRRCVSRLNRTAEAMLSRGDGLRLSRNAVVALRDSDAALQRAITEALRTALSDGASAGAAVVLQRGLGKRPFVAMVMPVSGDGELFAQSGGAAAIIVADPDAKPRFDEATVQKAFGWTGAETRVAMLLLSGLKAREIADRTSVSFETVRTQMKSLFAKSGIRSQAELVRVLTSLATTLSVAPS